MSDDLRATMANALVSELSRQDAGRLTLFLGAAPGVGKTFAMLVRAKELSQQGSDVVVGIVETHGRRETAALTQNLEILPSQKREYQGHSLEEMDLDALLARRPQIALVDELAHRNHPGSRHKYRWQDVLELLDAGIDVYSTVNIQHLESLNDVVQRITGIRVTETVPDSLLDRLRDIRLVDLPPRELIERLRQGKVYVPELAKQALHAFFSPSNLAALRELAMQTAADYLDDAWREAQTARGAEPVALRRRVLIAIDGRGQSEYLVRHGRRIAERQSAPWTVVSVQNPEKTDMHTQHELDKAFALARRLGGEADMLHGSVIVETLLDYAARSGVSTIIIGRTRERPFARLLNYTLTQQLLQRGAHYEITIVCTPQSHPQARPSSTAAPVLLHWQESLLALSATAISIILAWLAEQKLGLGDISMIFIVAVVLVASRTRMTGAVITALLGFLSYNFFFIEPRFTFEIAARQSLVTLLLFLVTALVAGRLAATLRLQVTALRAANTHAIVLQSLGRQLANAADLGQVAQAGRRALSNAFNTDVWISMDNTTPVAATPSFSVLDQTAADWTRQHNQPAGCFTNTLAGANWWFLPIHHDNESVGVAGLHVVATQRPPSIEHIRLLEAMLEDIAQAALRTRLVADLEAAKVSGETERLRSALLSSVSHDLRSPLAAMIGSASSLSNYADAMPPEDRQALLETIRLEGERLDRYIQNLLDMTRLGSTGLNLVRDWIGIDELIGSAVQRLQRYLPQACLNIELAAELPPLHVHPALVEQALFNVMENAVKFSPVGSPIDVHVVLDHDNLRIDIIDHGPGIPEQERSHIFDMFYSVERGDRGKQGSGLGLTICQGMIGAHGGQVVALPGTDGCGTCIRILLPLTDTLPTGESLA